MLERLKREGKDYIETNDNDDSNSEYEVNIQFNVPEKIKLNSNDQITNQNSDEIFSIDQVKRINSLVNFF